MNIFDVSRRSGRRKEERNILTGHRAHGVPLCLLSAAYELHSLPHTSNSNYYTLYNILQALTTPHVLPDERRTSRKWVAGHVGTIRHNNVAVGLELEVGFSKDEVVPPYWTSVFPLSLLPCIDTFTSTW